MSDLSETKKPVVYKAKHDASINPEPSDALRNLTDRFLH